MLRAMLPGLAVVLALCLLGGFMAKPIKQSSALAGSPQLPLPKNCMAFSCRHKDPIQLALEQN